MTPMKRRRFFPLVFVVVLAFFVLPLTSLANTQTREYKHPVTIPLRFDYYYSYEMVIEALNKLHQAYPGLTQLDLVGKSEEGRSIYCMTVNNARTSSGNRSIRQPHDDDQDGLVDEDFPDDLDGATAISA